MLFFQQLPGRFWSTELNQLVLVGSSAPAASIKKKKNTIV